MLGGLSLIAVVTAAITSGFVSRAQANGRTTGADPVMEKLDNLALELCALKAELEQRGPAPGNGPSGDVVNESPG